MGKVLIVRDVDEALVRRLKLRAARNDRSVAAEHRAILKEALSGEPDASFKEVAAQLRALTRGRRHTPAEVLLRESRAER